MKSSIWIFRLFLNLSLYLSLFPLYSFLNVPCGNFNECSVADNLDAITASGTLSSDLTFVMDSIAGQSVSVIQDALDQMHPAALSAYAEIQTELGGQLLSLFHRTPTLSCSCLGSARAWIEPFGNWLEEKDKGMQIRFNATTRGIAFGIDHQFFNCWTLGLGGAWNATDIEWGLSRGYSYIDGLYGAFYTDLLLSNFYLGGSVYAGKDSYDTFRQIHFTTVDRQAKSHSHALDVGGQFTAAYFLGTPSSLLYPYATIDYLYLKNSNFKESGADSLNLKVDDYESSTLRVEAGGAWRFIDRNRNDTMCISPLISFGYVLEHPLHRDSYQAEFRGQDLQFITKGWDETWQLLNFRFGLGITYRCFTLDSQYSGDISPDGGSTFFNQRANFRLSYTF